MVCILIFQRFKGLRASCRSRVDAGDEVPMTAYSWHLSWAVVLVSRHWPARGHARRPLSRGCVTAMWPAQRAMWPTNPTWHTNIERHLPDLRKPNPGSDRFPGRTHLHNVNVHISELFYVRDIAEIKKSKINLFKARWTLKINFN